MKSLSKNTLVFTLFILLLLNYSSTGSADVVYGNPPDDGEPVLQINKWSSASEARLGENITVYVNITNWSTADAFNLTITEPQFSDWALAQFQGYQKWDYVLLRSGSTISYEYTMNLKSEGNFLIEATIITYVNKNSTLFSARSSSIPLDIFREAPPRDLTDVWVDIRNFAIFFAAIPLAVLLVNNFLRDR